MSEMALLMRRVFPDAIRQYAALGLTLAEVLDEFDEEPVEQRRVVKVGHNDPCPCGSGKKFKKSSQMATATRRGRSSCSRHSRAMRR